MHTARCLAVSLVLAGAAFVARAEPPAAAPDWTVEGEWLDTCNCALPCPCWKSEQPTLKACQDLYYFHVKSGHYGKVKLDGVDVIGVGVSPEGKTMDKSVADKDMIVANLYLAKALAPDVAGAAEKIFTEKLVLVPPGSGKKHATKHVAMKASMSDAGAKVSIPGVLELDVKRTNKPFGIDTSVAPFSGKSVEGVQVRYDFSDDGQKWKLKGRNASFAPFSWSAQKEAAVKGDKK